MYYICIGVGLSALLVSDGLGNARAFRTWNGQQDWLHAFFIFVLPYGFIACRSQKRGMCFAYGKTFVMEISGFNTLLIGVVN